MSKFERLCAVSELSENSMIRVTLGEDLDVCVANMAGKFFAVADRCGHSNAPLSKGELEGSVVTCPLHAAQFDLISGAIVRLPNQPTPRPEGAAGGATATATSTATATAVAAPPAVVGAGVAGAAIRAMIRTLPVQTFNVETRGEELFIELP